MVKEIHGTYKIPYHPEGPTGPAFEIDFTPPFRRLRMFPDLEKATGTKLPDPTKLDTPESRKQLDDLCVKFQVDCTAPRTASRLLDKVSRSNNSMWRNLSSHFLSFLSARRPLFGRTVHQSHLHLRSSPSYVSLSQGTSLRAWTDWTFRALCYEERSMQLVHRVERSVHPARTFWTASTSKNRVLFFVRDYVHCLTACVSGAWQDKEAGDDEAQMIDETFCTSLEYGLPPTGGWGMGIDRMAMFLTNSNNIKVRLNGNIYILHI